MVVSTSSDPYSPFHPAIMSEDGPQSSEDSSGLHSPLFAPDHYPAHVRYTQDLEAQHSAALVASQFPYGHNMHAQQRPMLDSSLEPPNPSARVSFSSHYTGPTRNQLVIDCQPHSPVNSRIPSSPGILSLDYRYTSPCDKRLPGAPTRDHSYLRPTGHPSGLPVDSVVVSADMSLEAGSSFPEAGPSRHARKETSNVVIACRQCRSRKIRCDSTRPICNNCIRRSNDCEYDEKPRRRGPDKRPGTRQRSCKKRPTDGSAPPPKRTRTTSETPNDELEEASMKPKEEPESPTTSRLLDRHPPDFQYSPPSHPLNLSAPPSSAGLRFSDSNLHHKHDISTPSRRVYDQDTQRDSISFPRSFEPQQKTWWDRILRSHPLNLIFDEISFLVHNTGHLLSFVNLDHIMNRLYSEDRLQIQPAFVYAVLAMASLMKSSKLEAGSVGLSQAMDLINEAHAAYKDAIELHWLDVTLVEAAFILALFETSIHPQHSFERTRIALNNLDTLIRNLSLTTIDSHDSTCCRFPPGRVPVILTDTPAAIFSKDHQCSCETASPDHKATQDYPLPWNPSWSPREIGDEAIRRLCWASLIVISDYILLCETFNEDCPRFYLAEPANYCLLFPGEVIDRVSPAYRARVSLSPKESVWALYCRSILLWHFCRSLRATTHPEERVDYIREVVVEAQAIENALNVHTFHDKNLITRCREYILNMRVLITWTSRSNYSGISSPVLRRKQALDWLSYEDQVFHRLNALTQQLTRPEGYQLTRCPFQITWLVNQLASCLALWNHDTNLDEALRLGKLILNVTDVVNELWPCPVIHNKCASLRQQLSEACSSKRLDVPVPEGFALPHVLRVMRG